MKLYEEYQQFVQVHKYRPQDIWADWGQLYEERDQSKYLEERILPMTDEQMEAVRLMQSLIDFIHYKEQQQALAVLGEDYFG